MASSICRPAHKASEQAHQWHLWKSPSNNAEQETVPAGAWRAHQWRHAMVAQPTRMDGVWHKAMTQCVHLHQWRQTCIRQHTRCMHLGACQLQQPSATQPPAMPAPIQPACMLATTARKACSCSAPATHLLCLHSHRCRCPLSVMDRQLAQLRAQWGSSAGQMPNTGSRDISALRPCQPQTSRW